MGRKAQGREGGYSGRRPTGCLKLIGRDGWRIRVGVYRVIYQIDDQEKKIVILDFGHRRDIYR